ncbi:cation transporter [Cohnella sp. CIP 111063]|uniref:cation diffusion facilitator family transporter n=1 Tax=unclassified Cohnella TaxID=2636738 RepID=UPI000B8BD56A|nr:MULTISPECIES: cation diffusion facilitator family transporter [unclassified Cohnella]OXS59175.1 cation transporter [Cohnella sp. CIP 111063]PRX72182.1 cobalt-zinc-cadmium efflux system protein [Cohnella sp. SGD-V74]
MSNRTHDHNHAGRNHNHDNHSHDHGHNQNHDHNHYDHEHEHNHDNHPHDHGHGHHHDHGHHHGIGGRHHHFDGNRDGNKKGLTIALIITAGIMVLEFVGGLVTNSLALLSDSGHMLSDASALALSLVAFWFAARPASPNKTYGFYRFEILAALFNGVTLFVIAGFIMWEAYERFSAPPEVSSLSMLLIASVGLVANLLSALALMRKGDVKNNLNLRSAYLHVLGDALGSVGAIVAGIVMLAFGWYVADPIISVLVSLLILRSAWSVIKHTVHILMEGTPATIDQGAVKSALTGIPGVLDVHDLHIWTITSGMDSLSCHLLVEDASDQQSILQQAIQTIEEKFKIQHATIQIETSEIRHMELKV